MCACLRACVRACVHACVLRIQSYFPCFVKQHILFNRFQLLCLTDTQYMKVVPILLLAICAILLLATCMSSVFSLLQPTPPSRFVAGYVGAVTSAVTIAVSWLYFLLLHHNQFMHVWLHNIFGGYTACLVYKVCQYTLQAIKGMRTL